MTGEITLAGLVFPIGEVKEKVLAAKRAGLNRVILPLRNEPDAVDIPDDIRREMEVVYVDTVDDVLKNTIAVPVQEPVEKG